ncbi:hypothetical protein [Pseudomonas aeruginosa]|uniref:hypothetical protein n=1 Tax=Pseudomonas aeruginosa TaxID=287 RepID=UPI000997A89F|nr:hypothetical protein [Pseudomonas aeruginosa]ELK4791022.1 hypothetical protein [Pseudomonas aeruginosa]MBG6407265.1 hypothetical protein [Pseudomonas aeruginosa]MBH4130118.1 hypothetical protein [Pseudomonas aeruginosa]MBH4250197.1 hypothetical protein [Pseudomonas aeruginosa]MCT4882765.1 hypothetical protein [Pseudomonas aeruginosa]
MQSGDDGLAKLAEKLHGIRENLPGADGETPNVPASDIRIKRNSGNVNFGTQVNIGAPIISEPIALSQRRSLNNKVEEIAGIYGVDPRVIWREVLHTRFGIGNVGELSKAQYVEAVQALDAHEAQLKALAAENREQSHVKRLVAEVLQLANSRGAYQDMAKFCSREFGLTVLNDLSPDQLKLVLKYLDEATIAQDLPTKEAAAERQTSPRPTAYSLGGFVAEAKALVLQYPIHCGAIALVLLMLGKII